MSGWNLKGQCHSKHYHILEGILYQEALLLTPYFKPLLGASIATNLLPLIF